MAYVLTVLRCYDYAPRKLGYVEAQNFVSKMGTWD
jgi:hypothetical protein